jgi:hypothetical protein
MYYIDRKLDVPKKLHDWANSFSLPYLSTHTDKVLPVDTITVGFEAWAKRANNIYSWNKVIGSAKTKRRNQIARKNPLDQRRCRSLLRQQTSSNNNLHSLPLQFQKN